MKVIQFASQLLKVLRMENCDSTLSSRLGRHLWIADVAGDIALECLSMSAWRQLIFVLINFEAEKW